MWLFDRNRTETYFFERGTSIQELAFGRAAEGIKPTTGTFYIRIFMKILGIFN